MTPLPHGYKRHITRLIDKLRWEFFANEYFFRTRYFDEIPRYERAAAAIDISPTYLEATLKVSKQVLTMWQAKDYQEIARVLVHEFAHLLTEPLYLIACDGTARVARDLLEDVRERQTQRIANIVFTRLPKQFWMPERRPVKHTRTRGKAKR